MQKDSGKWYPVRGLRLLSSDSLGVRSFSIFVDTGEEKIIIDPGLDIAPLRFDLPPHPLEIERFYELKSRIIQYLGMAEVIIISHFHHDHFTRELVPMYMGKRLIMKDPQRNINFMQKKRAREITDMIKDYEIADGREFRFKGGSIKFSRPLPHGTTPAVVLSTFIETDRFKLLHTSDISGPIEEKAMRFILEMKPDILILDGPALYINKKYRDTFLKNMDIVFEKLPDVKLVIDHHTTRDPGWRNELASISKKAITFAGYNGLEDQPLEGMRKTLWESCFI